MSEWMPGALQRPQPGGVTLDTSLPPRFVWHITWDQLKPDGSQPAFSAVADYLARMKYCPHIMWNPFTGYMEQYYPASVGGRALKYNNQDGAACIQVEVFFTPGCVVDGVRYDTVADTPLVGFADLLAWGESLGVPLVWPMGAPQWQGNNRDAAIWNANAGHYGHCHSPGDTHTDPGPMPDLKRGGITLQSQSITPLEEDVPLTKEEVDWIAGRVAEVIQPMHDVTRAFIPGAVWDVPLPYRDPVTGAETGQKTTGKTVMGFTDFNHNATRTALPAAVLNQKFTLPDGTVTNLAGILAAINAKPTAAGGTAMVASDPAAIADAVVNAIVTNVGIKTTITK
ncbi:hypothetical protein [Pseudarthrobacter sp. NIBRBAC000502771]|uniref:hypothetical protein n=1 Tax=Pseudarthrobacter sp. NIBRBAC000502771 TaxID=2590774 RepID=UPI0011301ACD|nr:hypothetical protein [Pseudarthrobacter sp. NIBRBAC000502771]QDG61251.1 hypothetical protein NIBR502771_02290 [Pseudarthrobacter sp. NIBRBAC000502771]